METKSSIDLNSDLGEGYGRWLMGDDAAMLDLVTSANVACGGHAGDPDIMFSTLIAAKARHVTIGAHPGYPDREGFGRRLIPFDPASCERFLAAQIGALCGVAALAGATVEYVKVHGALGLLVADDRAMAAAVARATRAVDPSLAVLAISGTVLEDVARDHDLTVFAEIFADRAYKANGRLVPRSEPGAVLKDPAVAAARMLGFVRTGLMPTLDGPPIRLVAHSICVHSDSQGAVELARRLRERLSEAEVTLAPFRLAAVA